MPVLPRISDCSLFIVVLLLITDGNTHTTTRYKPNMSSNKTPKVTLKIFFINMYIPYKSSCVTSKTVSFLSFKGNPISRSKLAAVVL